MTKPSDSNRRSRLPRTRSARTQARVEDEEAIYNEVMGSSSTNASSDHKLPHAWIFPQSPQPVLTPSTSNTDSSETSNLDAPVLRDAVLKWTPFRPVNSDGSWGSYSPKTQHDEEVVKAQQELISFYIKMIHFFESFTGRYLFGAEVQPSVVENLKALLACAETDLAALHPEVHLTIKRLQEENASKASLDKCLDIVKIDPLKVEMAREKLVATSGATPASSVSETNAVPSSTTSATVVGCMPPASPSNARIEQILAHPKTEDIHMKGAPDHELDLLKVIAKMGIWSELGRMPAAREIRDKAIADLERLPLASEARADVAAKLEKMNDFELQLQDLITRGKGQLDGASAGASKKKVDVDAPSDGQTHDGKKTSDQADSGVVVTEKSRTRLDENFGMNRLTKEQLERESRDRAERMSMIEGHAPVQEAKMRLEVAKGVLQLASMSGSAAEVQDAKKRAREASLALFMAKFYAKRSVEV